jgi:RNA polymerase sigma factor (sigma-70 family)
MHINQELITACLKSERKAQFELYHQCYSVLMGVCIRYKNNREDAIEILNQGFLKVLNNLNKYEEKVPFEAWIRRIMINTIIDEYRKGKKASELVKYTDFETGAHNERHVDYNEADKQLDAEELEDMLKQLPPISQKVFNLYAVDGYSHKEVSEMLDISVGTSKWHVSFARAKLQKMIIRQMNTVKSSAS